MNWETMPQKQKQILVGSVVGGIALLYALFQFGWKPYAKNRADSEAELADLKAKIEKAVQASKNEDILMEDLRAASDSMTRVSRELVPTPENSLSWVTRAIYAQARKVGVDIESVSETGEANAEFTSKDQANRAFKPYGVIIATRCSYAKMVQFVEALESTNPHLMISNISISANPSKDQHDVNLIVHWPLWKKAEKAREIEAEAASQPAPKPATEGTPDA